SGSDAWGNLFGALRRLQAGIAPGVYLYFHDRLLHGARASKLSRDAFDAFAELPRLRQGAHASAWPASLSYRQPRQPVRLAVLPLHP
ncbi:asparaginase domain-containing protein, partial [Escherichia ruysiae]|uniref:asparaginase domain-containing protein n=1 Tax=Escherichia ruysiae TaxID=2608867 RepID=UPI00215B7526